MLSILPRYRHIVNPKLKHTYLGFDSNGELVIRSPRVSQAYLEALLIKKASWIRRSQENILKKKGRQSDLFSGSLLFFLGTAYPLELQRTNQNHTSLVFSGSKFTMQYTRFDMTFMQKHVDRFYKKEATELIPSLVKKWSTKMGLTPQFVYFRKTRRQWGSCSAKNSLSFNTMLMKLPLEAIEYVVVHELAHIEHKHHQHAFWDLVSRHLPDYKTRQHILNQYIPV